MISPLDFRHENLNSVSHLNGFFQQIKGAPCSIRLHDRRQDVAKPQVSRVLISKLFPEKTMAWRVMVDTSAMAAI